MGFLFSVNMDGIDSTLIFLSGITFQLVICGEPVKNDPFLVNGFHFDQEKKEKLTWKLNKGNLILEFKTNGGWFC